MATKVRVNGRGMKKGARKAVRKGAACRAAGMGRDPQLRMEEVVQAAVKSGRERGVQVAAYLAGQLVVDVCAGVADPATGRKVDRETLFPVYSVSKGIASTMLHMFVERGKISYDTPVAAVWPEFAAHGKGNVLVRHVLAHAAGLHLMPAGLKHADLLNWGKVCAAIADLAPVAAPGAETMYHAVTFGYLVGEVMRRVDGRSFEHLLEEEVCRPLGIKASLYVGMPANEEGRVATIEEVYEAGKRPEIPDDSQPQVVPGYMMPLDQWMNRSEARRACLPASSGMATARALARVYAALCPGGVDGVELLSPVRVRAAAGLQLAAKAEGKPSQALGYQLGGYSPGMGSRWTAFGHGGYGGALGYADPECGLAVGLTKNLFSARSSRDEILRELRRALGVPE